ncbi:hypothetical protein LCGC14_0406680 [marine sediment metagenome]|uniref:Uncharacterized protein n=1 Tax=marine sediment metagenome TaxID=412755 RepID=A0A0F9W465_9ZZZZ
MKEQKEWEVSITPDSIIIEADSIEEAEEIGREGLIERLDVRVERII